MFGGKQVYRFSLIFGDTHCFNFTYIRHFRTESCLWGGKFVITGKLNNTPHFSKKSKTKSMMIPLLLILQKIRCVLVGPHPVFIRLYDYIVAQEILTFLAMPLFIKTLSLSTTINVLHLAVNFFNCFQQLPSLCPTKYWYITECGHI